MPHFYYVTCSSYRERSRFFSLFPLKAVEGNTILLLFTHALQSKHPPPWPIPSTQDSLAPCGAPEQMLNHLLLCVLGLADDLPLDCSGNTSPTLRTPFCFPSRLRENKKMLYTSSRQLLLFASRNNLVGKIHNGYNKQQVVFLMPTSYPEATLRASPRWVVLLHTPAYRDSASKNAEENQEARRCCWPPSVVCLFPSHRHITVRKAGVTPALGVQLSARCLRWPLQSSGLFSYSTPATECSAMFLVAIQNLGLSLIIFFFHFWNKKWGKKWQGCDWHVDGHT